MQPNIIENFLSKETCEYLNKYFKSNFKLSDQGYETIYLSKNVEYYSDSFFLNKKNKEFLEDYIIYDLLNLLMNCMTKQFNFQKNDIYIEIMNYRNFGIGQEVKDYHVDQYGEGDVYTALLYLNDDYEGGEIVFYDGKWQNKNNFTSYHPKPGTLIYFKGDDNYPHSINEVKSGFRSNILINLRVNKKEILHATKHN